MNISLWTLELFVSLLGLAYCYRRIYRLFFPSFYIAGKWGDRQKIGAVIDKLAENGLYVTHDWTRTETANRSRTPDSLGDMAQADIDGVKACDVFVAFMDDPEYAYRGTFCEMGAALAANKEVYAITPPFNSSEEPPPQCATNVFFWHPLVRHVPSIQSIFPFFAQFQAEVE